MRRTALFFLLPAFGALPAISQSVPGYAIPNAKHYRESGVGNATGRSGSAHLTARALLGQDGNTTIEVSTGTLDSSATPPGSFKKVQLKPLDPNGNAMFAQNFTQLSTDSGYYTFIWPSLYRHQQAQIQGNITGIDNRTDVVTVVETVKLRPDLAVVNLSVPDSAIVSSPVTISANIAEVNGDSSATTTCQLAVDGINVDQATNVFVDAAGSVSCMFNYSFTSTGSHTVQVSATNVAPADWDTGNNSASGTINIVNLNAETAENGSVRFVDQKGDFTPNQTVTSQAWLGGSLGYSYSNTTATTGEQQSTQSKFYSGGCVGATNAVPYQFPLTVTYTETMDGTQVYSGTGTGLTGSTSSVSSGSSMCGSTAATLVQQMASGFSSGLSYRVISQAYYDSASTLLFAYQEVDANRSAGDVTYFSSGYQCGWWADCNNPPTNYYTWNTSTPTVTGTVVTPGSTWTPNLTVSDAGGNAFGGSLSVSLVSNPFTSSKPNKCTNTGPDANGYTYQNCSSSTTSYTITQGSASF